MKAINLVKFSLILAAPLAIFGCSGNQYTQKGSNDDLYFSRSDRRVIEPYNESTSSAGYSQEYRTNQDTDLDYGDEEYTARDVNPEYIAQYKKQGEVGLEETSEAPEEDVYFEEDYDRTDQSYSNYTGGNAYSRPNNGAWQNNPYYAGYNRWNSPYYNRGWNNMYNPGWNFGMRSGWSNWGSGFGWSIGYNWGNPWGWNDPWMNPYAGGWGWNDPWMNPYYSRFGGGWAYDPFYGRYYPVAYNPYYRTQRVIVVRPEPGLNGNTRYYDGRRTTRSNSVGVSDNSNSRANRRLASEPSSVDGDNQAVTPDGRRYSTETPERNVRTRSGNSTVDRNRTRGSRTTSPNSNTEKNNNTYQRSRSNRNNTYQRNNSNSGSRSGTYQRNRSNRSSSGGGSGTYQRNRSNSSSGGGGSSFSSPRKSSSSGSRSSGSYSGSRTRSSSGNSSSGGGSRTTRKRGGGEQ